MLQQQELQTVEVPPFSAELAVRTSELLSWMRGHRTGFHDHGASALVARSDG
jgi:hypothetical protein